MTTNDTTAPRTGVQPLTGTIHFAHEAKLYGNIHLVTSCQQMSMATARHSLVETFGEEVTCKKCLAGFAAAARKAAAVVITEADGSPLKDGHGYPLRTIVAARNELSHQVQNIAWYGDAESKGHAARLAAALRAEGSIDVDKVISNAAKKAAKEGAPHAGAAF